MYNKINKKYIFADIIYLIYEERQKILKNHFIYIVIIGDWGWGLVSIIWINFSYNNLDNI